MGHFINETVASNCDCRCRRVRGCWRCE